MSCADCVAEVQQQGLNEGPYYYRKLTLSGPSGSCVGCIPGCMYPNPRS